MDYSLMSRKNKQPISVKNLSFSQSDVEMNRLFKVDNYHSILIQSSLPSNPVLRALHRNVDERSPEYVTYRFFSQEDWLKLFSYFYRKGEFFSVQFKTEIDEDDASELLRFQFINGEERTEEIKELAVTLFDCILDDGYEPQAIYLNHPKDSTFSSITLYGSSTLMFIANPSFAGDETDYEMAEQKYAHQLMKEIIKVVDGIEVRDFIPVPLQEKPKVKGPLHHAYEIFESILDIGYEETKKQYGLDNDDFEDAISAIKRTLKAHHCEMVYAKEK